MSDRLFEHAVHEWLEEGSDRTPPAAIDAVLFAIKTTPQQQDLRIPRRFITMSVPARLTAAAVIVAAVIGGGSLLANRLLYPPVGASPTPSLSVVTVAPTPTAGPAQPWVLMVGDRANASDPHKIWLAHRDGSGLHELSPGTPYGKSTFDVSPDGQRVVFTSVGPSDVGEFQIWEVGIDGGTPRLLSTDCPGPWGQCSEMDPAYTPDGRRVAFVRVGPGESAVVGIRDLDSGNVTLLEATRTNDLLSRPTWSPDGRRLAYSKWFYSKYSPGARAHLYLIANDGTGLVDLSLEVAATNPVWSPDGSTIVFEGVASIGAPPGPSTIYTVRPDGSGLKVVVAAEDGETVGFGPSWTPDGSRILYWDGATKTWLLLDPASGATERLFAGEAPVDTARPIVARLQPLP